MKSISYSDTLFMKNTSAYYDFLLTSIISAVILLYILVKRGRILTNVDWYLFI